MNSSNATGTNSKRGEAGACCSNATPPVFLFLNDCYTFCMFGMESPHNRKNLTEAEKHLQKRRKLLKFGLGATTGFFTGMHVGEKGLEMYNEREEFQALEKMYAGMEEDFQSALEVVDLFLRKMKEVERKHNMKDGTFIMSSTDGAEDSISTDSMKFLRDFLTKHLLRSNASERYDDALKSTVKERGYYAKSNLTLIRGDIERVLRKQKEKKKRFL